MSVVLAALAAAFVSAGLLYCVLLSSSSDTCTDLDQNSLAVNPLGRECLSRSIGQNFHVSVCKGIIDVRQFMQNNTRISSNGMQLSAPQFEQLARLSHWVRCAVDL